MATKKISPKQKTSSIEGLLAITAFILPLIAWLVAALINPTGWASDQPEIILTILIYVPIMYWQITLPVCVCVCIFACFYYRKINGKNVSILLLIISVVLSAYVFQLTASADESEFTG